MKKALLAVAILVLVAGALGARYYLRRKGAALALGALGALVDKGPKAARVVRGASGDAVALEDAFINNHKALMAGDWEEFKKWTRAENVRQIEAAGGAKMLPLARAMTPASVAVGSARIEGARGVLDVKGELLGKPTAGRIALVREDGRWKVAEMSWNASATAAPSAAVPAGAFTPPPAPRGETDADVNFFCRTSNFRGTITLNGAARCAFGDKGKDYQFGCPAFFDKVRYGENAVDVEFASLGDPALPHRLEIRVARYDRAKKTSVDLKSWSLTAPEGGNAGLFFTHRRP